MKKFLLKLICFLLGIAMNILHLPGFVAFLIAAMASRFSSFWYKTVHELFFVIGLFSLADYLLMYDQKEVSRRDEVLRKLRNRFSNTCKRG